MELQVIDAQGKSASTVSASDDVFGREYNERSFIRVWSRIRPMAVAPTVRRRRVPKFATRPKALEAKGYR